VSTKYYTNALELTSKYGGCNIPAVIPKTLMKVNIIESTNYVIHIIYLIL